MKILCIGDIVGKPGRNAVKGLLKEIKGEQGVGLVIANAENAAGGSGLSRKIAEELLSEGCDVLTLGDHAWDQKEMEEYLDEGRPVLRPGNFRPLILWKLILVSLNFGISHSSDVLPGE